MLRFRFASSLAALAVAALAACAPAPDEDVGDGSGAFVADYTTPDPGNLWTRGVDLSRLALGEETVLPDEEAMFAGFAKEVASMQDRLAQRAGAKVRGFHAKAHACVRGELHVRVPPALARARVGLFAEDASYPTWVRFSNGTGFVQADAKGDVRGLALKVMKVPGGGTQDFLMTNGATTPAPDARQFVTFGKALTDARVGPDGEAVGAFESLLHTGEYLLRSENKRVREYLLTKALPRVATRGSMFAEQFWTGGAFALGVAPGDPLRAPARAAAKLTAVAGVLQGGECKPVRDLPNLLDDDYFRTDIANRTKVTETCLDLRLQLQNDPAKQPLEDTSVEWREADAPFVSVGYVQIPRKNLAATPELREEAFCNQLGFTPWHALREHRPLGNIMRARRPIYETSREGRGGSGEPTGDEFR